MGLFCYLKKLRDEYVINQAKCIELPYFTPSPIVRRKVLFSGMVLNPGFALEVYELAKRLNLSGWVTNRDGKNVEAEIQGENEKVNFLIKYMQSLKITSVKGVVINEEYIVYSDADFIMI